ncbi:hypothetical protein EDF46_3467 [Frondihabitans sp. PhB188]|uniref:hypothetical protein n=1 Tax=Frondihabitans sp. PhB188 TaxID=2485200 RepID=UPI000F470B14|nr:hypothetical protein [Frondihabitans sp. PhB188]ROQ30955.1 hypothetical protein EDF46_3467 [Frondihabitans sp. PhB188]
MAPIEFSLHAWGDESMRTVNVVEPVYLLGAVVADPTACEEYRDQLQALPRSERKLHWRNLDRRHRNTVINTITAFDVHHVIVVGTPLDPRKQERARALCLERLTWELSELGVTQLVLEARPESLMKKDRQHIDALRGRGALPATLRVDHGLPSEEPMLWIADQALGALGESLAGDNAWFEQLAASVNVIRIDV